MNAIKIDGTEHTSKLQAYLETELLAGRVCSRPDGMGAGGVWVSGIASGAMDACLRQMAEAGLLSEKCLGLLVGLN